MLHQVSASPVFPILPSPHSHFVITDEAITPWPVRDHEVLVSESCAGDKHVVTFRGAEPTLRQAKKDRILDQVAILEQATIAMLDRRLSRELRERARQETRALMGTLEPLGLTVEARLIRGIDHILKKKFPFEEILMLQLAEFVVALRESVERKTDLL